MTVNKSNSVLSRLSKNNLSPIKIINNLKLFYCEMFLTNLFNNNVPRVIRSCTTHNSSQNGISSIHISFSFTQFTNNGIVSSSNLKFTTSYFGFNMFEIILQYGKCGSHFVKISHSSHLLDHKTYHNIPIRHST